MVEPWTPPPPKAAIVKRPDNLYPERGKFEQRPKNGGHWAPGERHNALKSEEMCTFWNEKHEIKILPYQKPEIQIMFLILNKSS